MIYPSKARMILEIMRSMWKYDIEYVYEMSTRRGQALTKIQSYSEPMVEHLIKIVAMPTSSARNHWIHELAVHVKNVNKIKLKNNQKLTAEDYFELLFEDWFTQGDMESVVVFLQDLRDEYGANITFSQTMFTHLNRLANSISVLLASGKTLSLSEIKQTIERNL